MAAAGALEIFPQIQALVLDKLQVVSYKWLSRNFLVSSNTAKRFLEEFVGKHSNELEVIYTLSGWLKNDPHTYCVKLASAHKLEELKQRFKDNCSVQVYSVQACIPNDLAVIWNAEFVQAEELFDRPSTEENCLRDNRFCGVSNLLVKRILDGKHAGITAPWLKNSMVETKETKSNSSMKFQPVQPPQNGFPGKSDARNVMQSTVISSDKSEKFNLDAVSKSTKPSLVKESVAGGNGSKNKGHNDKAATGTGLIASLWSNASAKSKAAETVSNAPIAAGITTAEAQICAQEALDAASSEDEDNNKNIKRETNSLSNRKRRVILDFSDDDVEEENVVSLASPDIDKVKEAAVSFPVTESSLETRNSNLEEVKGVRLKDRLDNLEEQNSLLSSNDDTRRGRSIMAGGISIKEKTHNPIQQGSDNNKRDEIADPASSSPKRRKVLKTSIDDRGREVTEVVWEGEAAENDKPEKITDHTTNRLPVANKAQPQSSGPTNPGGKGRNKKPGKGGPKDAKQGNILSFFKRA